MTIPKEKLSLEDIKGVLLSQVANGEILSSCPICNTYLSLVEYKTRKCFCCKKQIKFNDILYYPGAKKENN